MQTDLSIEGIYVCGIKMKKGMSINSGAVCFGDQIRTSFTLLPLGWLNSWDPHWGPQQLQTSHSNSLMNIKTSPASHALIGLNYVRCPNLDLSPIPP